MRTVEITHYEFEELSPDAQAVAIEKVRTFVTDYEWCDDTIEMLDEMANMIGINTHVRDVPAIHFSGFSSQGDGAHFEGTYEYKKGAYKAIKAEFPTCTKLHMIAEALQDLQRKNFYKLSASVKHNGHYQHEMCTHIEVYDANGNESTEDTHNQLSEILRDFMRFIYKTLEEEYDYISSDEQVKEFIVSNEYEFLANGTLV